jgi:hypothetical protein
MDVVEPDEIITQKRELIVATPGKPAKEDPARNANGTLRPGCTAAVPKTKSRGVFAKAAASLHGHPATSEDRMTVANQLGIHAGAIPTRGSDGPMTLGELLAWFITQRALRGSIESLREILDRTDPKPKRLEISGEIIGRRGAVAPGADPNEREAADSYFDAMNGET